MTTYTDLNITPRTLMGPGPSDVAPRVLRALAHPPVGHLDPQFVKVMDEVQELLRFIFETGNEMTIPISGTGSAGMEAAVANFVEPGDPVLVCINGYFGMRIAEMASRYGAEVDRIEKPWGEVFAPEDVDAALRRRPAKVVAMVHGETSTGAMQPLDGMAEVVHRHGGLLLVDTVASLGGVAGQRRPARVGHRLQRQPEGPQRAARPGSADRQPARAGGSPSPREQGRQLVPRPDAAGQLLGAGAACITTPRRST